MIDFCYQNPEVIREDGNCPIHGWSCSPSGEEHAGDEETRDNLIFSIMQCFDELSAVVEEEFDDLDTSTLRQILTSSNSIRNYIDKR